MHNVTAAVVHFLQPVAVTLGKAVWNLPRNILILLLMAYRKVISLVRPGMPLFPFMLGVRP